MTDSTDGAEASSPCALRFDGRVAIVTGAGRGLGREFALDLARRGASILVNDIGNSPPQDPDPSVGQAVVDEIRSLGGTAESNLDNVTLPGVGERIVQDAVQKLGRIDIVVNNAGGARSFKTPLEERTPEDVEFAIAVNLRSTIELTLAAWSRFSAQSYGRLVNISSASAFGMMPGFEYAMVKAGLIGLTRSFAMGGSAIGTAVNCVMPSAFTRMSAGNNTDPELRRFAEEHLGPERIAQLVSLLAHERCPVNGQVFTSAGKLISNVLYAETAGSLFDSLTSESILAGMQSVMNRDSVSFPDSLTDYLSSMQKRYAVLTD